MTDDFLRRPVVGDRQGRHAGRQTLELRSHVGHVPGMLTLEPLPERSLDGLGQRLTRLGSQLPGEPVRLVTLDTCLRG